MTALDALQAVQFITVKGKRLAVLDGDDWEALVEWLETLEDMQLARSAIASLNEAGGDRVKAGWKTWDEVEGQLE